MFMKPMMTTVPTKKPKEIMDRVVFYSFHILQALLFFGIGRALRSYEENTASLGEFFYPATVFIGFIVGIIMLVMLFCTEQNPRYLKEHPRPKTWGIILIIALLCLMLVLAAAGVAASMLWHPDMSSHAGFTYLFGVVPGAAAVCILRYLPHVLPQKEAEE